MMSLYTLNHIDTLLFIKREFENKFQRCFGRILLETAIHLVAHMYGSYLRKPMHQVRKSVD